MSLEPLLAASPIIQIHAFAATAAFGLGGFVLFRRKGDGTHRRLGRLWVILMLATALTSFFIWQSRLFGLFSPIHLLSLMTLGTLWLGVRYARQRSVQAHMRTMQSLYLGALVIAGWFTFMPGRIMNEVVFGPQGGSPFESAAFLATSIAVGADLIWSSVAPAARKTHPAPLPPLSGPRTPEGLPAIADRRRDWRSVRLGAGRQCSSWAGSAEGAIGRPGLC